MSRGTQEPDEGASLVSPTGLAPCIADHSRSFGYEIGFLLSGSPAVVSRPVLQQPECEDGRLIVTVDDDGKGIAHERRQEIVLRGARADEQVEGSGLGLAIVDELARLYGGEVRLDDSPLGGTRALLVLPAAT